MTREEAIKENNRRMEAEQEVFDGLCTDLTTLPLRKIKIYTPDRKNRCQNDELVAGNTYLIVRNGLPSFGTAQKAWFGWQFSTKFGLHQLDTVDMVFEIDIPEFPKEPLGRVAVPPEDEDDCDGACDVCYCGGCK